MPRRLVLIRHGQSEANAVQKKKINGLAQEIIDEVYSRPDWMHRLSALGIEQSKASGDWVRKEIGPLASFDVIYSSPFMRTFETACHAAGTEDVVITPEDRIIERDWGLFGELTKEDQARVYEKTYRNKKVNPLYTRLDGGESVMDVYARIRDMHTTLHREHPDGTVLMFTHGDFMRAERYVNERMLPEEFIAMLQDSTQDLRNGTVIEWTRENPTDPDDVRERLTWVRIVHPTALQLSPNGGNWVEMDRKRTFTVSEGLSRVVSIPTLLPEGLHDELHAAEEAKRQTDSENRHDSDRGNS